ncbi:MAG: tyrosine-type recombinase/integrase, partial [Bacteroidota bacterium]
YMIEGGPLWRSFSNNSYGKALSDRSIYSIVKKYAARSGLAATVGAHTLRHTGCTLAIEQGASLQQVQAHARHKRIETTMVYIHQRDRLRDSAADHIRLDV